MAVVMLMSLETLKGVPSKNHIPIFPHGRCFTRESLASAQVESYDTFRAFFDPLVAKMHPGWPVQGANWPHPVDQDVSKSLGRARD